MMGYRLQTASLTLLLAFATGVPAYAQGIEWETLNDEVMELASNPV